MTTERYTIEGMEMVLNAMRENGHIFGWGYMNAGDAPEHPEVVIALFDAGDTCHEVGETFMFQRDWLRTEMVQFERKEMYQVLLFSHRIPELIRLMAYRLKKDTEWDDTHAFGEVQA
jgi:hypothetical protein